jgi:hypothetical protein
MYKHPGKYEIMLQNGSSRAQQNSPSLDYKIATAAW